MNSNENFNIMIKSEDKISYDRYDEDMNEIKSDRRVEIDFGDQDITDDMFIKFCEKNSDVVKSVTMFKLHGNPQLTEKIIHYIIESEVIGSSESMVKSSEYDDNRIEIGISIDKKSDMYKFFGDSSFEIVRIGENYERGELSFYDSDCDYNDNYFVASKRDFIVTNKDGEKINCIKIICLV